MNYCYFRVSGLFSTLEDVCTTFGTHDAVERAFKRRNILNGIEITYSYRQNRRIIAICVCMGLLRRWKSRALRSSRMMQYKERLNAEIY